MPERPDGDPDPEPLVSDMDQTFHKSARYGSRSRNSAGCWSYLSKRRLSNNNDIYKVHAFLNDNDVLDGHISVIFMFLRRHDSHGQCFGSGFGWTRIQFGPGSRIRIRIRNPDPEPGPGFRIQVSKNWYKKPKFTMSNSICNSLTMRTEKCSN